MKNNNFFRKVISLVLAFVMSFSIILVTASAGARPDKPLDIHLTLETKEIDLADIPENRVVSLKVYMKNCPPIAGMWVYFEKDPRLEFKEVFPFSVVEGVEGLCPPNTTSNFDVEPNKMGCGIAAEYGKLFDYSGAVLTVNVVIPENAKAGDFYPVNFSRYLAGSYMSVDFSDEFADRCDESSFTKLIGGGIRITDKSKTTTTTKKPVTTTKKPETTTTAKKTTTSRTTTSEKTTTTTTSSSNSTTTSEIQSSTTSSQTTTTTATTTTTITTTTTASTPTETTAQTSFQTEEVTAQQASSASENTNKSGFIFPLLIVLIIIIIVVATIVIIKKKK